MSDWNILKKNMIFPASISDKWYDFIPANISMEDFKWKTRWTSNADVVKALIQSLYPTKKTEPIQTAKK